MRKWRFDEMTRREALDYLRRNDLVYVPLGPIEVHGDHLPLGCDYQTAEAFALRLAQETDGVYVAPITFGFCGATEALKPTLGLSLETELTFLKGVVQALLGAGFKRIFFVSGHGPARLNLDVLCRWAYRELKHPVAHLRVFHVVPKAEALARFGIADDPALEATLLLGALKLLGRSHLVAPSRWRDEEEWPNGHPAQERLAGRGGYVGLEYYDPRQHIAARSGLSADTGVRLIEAIVAKMKGAAADLGEYLAFVQSRRAAKSRALRPAPKRPSRAPRKPKR